MDVGAASRARPGKALVTSPKKPLSKRQLEVRLGKLKTLQDPQLKLEQYPVSPEVASELLFMAGFEHNDLQEQVIDLGTGTGRLAIGAYLMGAKQVLGIDVDRRAVSIADDNSRKARANVDWIIGNLDAVRGTYDTAIMNPPYGTRIRHSDTTFLVRALELAQVVYSIHKSSTRPFLLQLAKGKSWKVDTVRSMSMKIPRLFEFHRKKWQEILVDLYRITS